MSSSHLVETVLINFEDFSESFLTCGTCLCVYDGGEHTPKLLPCSHTVCRTCLDRILETGARNESFRCPICREGIAVPRGGAASFPPSFLVNQLLDLMASQRRDVVPKCSRHPAQELLFCETCDAVFCATCVGGSHSGRGALAHNVISFSIAIKRMSEILLYKAHLCIQQLSSAYDLVVEEMGRLDSNTDKCEQTINTSFEELVSLVDARRQELLGMLRKLREEKRRVLKEQLDMIAAEKAKVQLDCDGLQYQMDVRTITKRIADLNGKLDAFGALSEPRENAFIRYDYKHNGTLVELDSQLKQFGRIKISTTYPGLCTATLEPATVHLKSRVHVRTVDYHGKPRMSGSDPVSAELRNEKNELVPTQLCDKCDGSYVVEFTPSQPGQHRLRVAIFDRPIRDSPFLFDVAGQQRPAASSGGTRGSAAGQFVQPFGVTPAADKQSLYVLDTGNSRIVELDCELRWRRCFGGSAMSEQGGTGLAAGDEGRRLWVANWRDRTVFELDPITEEMCSKVTHKEFKEPTSVAVAHSENGCSLLYVADNGAGCVFVVEPGGRLRRRLGYNWRRTAGLLVDSQNQRLVIAEHTRLRLVDLQSGTEMPGSPMALPGGARSGQLGGVALDEHGRLLVSRTSGLVQVFESSAGGHLFDLQPAEEERLRRPAGLASLGDGWLVVADMGNNAVKKFRYT